MKQRTEFVRVTPEFVGLHSHDIEWLLETLETSDTEMHSLMIMRHGMVCAEGWWAPFAPGIVHGLQSHTKTYAATAVGIAITQGLLQLDTKIIDIFPDHTPTEISENLALLTVRDVLCMGCGMDTMPPASADWIRDFLAMPVKHKPGTTYMYNSTGSTLLCAIAARATGVAAGHFLQTELFDKIGIDGRHLIWDYMPDGTEVGGGGLYATTEDNLRLMKLYADGGVWDGQRILSEEFVRLATTVQNESASEYRVNPSATDNFLGYGFQIWMCKPQGSYRADGAMGQFTIVLPEHDMIIALTETATGEHWGQQTLDILWAFLERIGHAYATLEEDLAGVESLHNRLRRLALPAPTYAPYSPLAAAISRKRYNVKNAGLQLGLNGGKWMSGREGVGDVKAFIFNFEAGSCELVLLQEQEERSLKIAIDGSRADNVLDFYIAPRVLLSGAWISESVFEIRARWIQTCFEKSIVFDFTMLGQAVIHTRMAVGGLTLFTASEEVSGIIADCE